MFRENGAPVSGRAEGGGAADDAPATGPEQQQALQVQVQAPPPPQSNQLTLSFQGEVYVFDSVQPERVQAVLLLLGGQELPSEVGGAPIPDHFNHRLNDDVARPYSNPRRLASIMRYKEKKKNLCFDRKVLYEVRKDVASRMKRHKGQFASSKANSEEALSPSSSSEPGQDNAQEEPVSNFCQNCRTAKESTPMMRRGPAGPRSLCNACGLMWANKGMLRAPSQPPAPGAQHAPINPAESSPVKPAENPPINLAEQSDANDSDVRGNGHMFSAAPNGPESSIIASIDASMEFVDS